MLAADTFHFSASSLFDAYDVSLSLYFAYADTPDFR